MTPRATVDCSADYDRSGPETAELLIQLSLASLLVLCLIPAAFGRDVARQESNALAAPSAQGSQVIVPNRPANRLYRGEQGVQRSEIEFNPATHTVTIKAQVEDPNGYFLPNIRRENFAVYENGVRQKDVTVDVEYAPVAVASLMEFGGRYHRLNETLGLEVHEVGREILRVLGPDDQIAVLKYGAKLETVVAFNQGRELAEKAFGPLGPPGLSELNFYDAVVEALDRMREVSRRKAIIVVSSGLDTFSKASYQQVLRAARESATPIYTLGLIRIIERESAAYGSTAPFARIDWSGAEKRLEMLAQASGGRAYVLESDVDIPAICDDIMENLRMRYVITYVSSNTAASGPPRKIRVELIDPKTGQALRIRSSDGRPVAARVLVEGSYTVN